jgi:hypothetical protein
MRYLMINSEIVANQNNLEIQYNIKKRVLKCPSLSNYDHNVFDHLRLYKTSTGYVLVTSLYAAKTEVLQALGFGL